MTTFATLFSGGELAGVGMRNAGLVHRWGIELDDAIATVARLNGFNVITADILDVDPAGLEPVDALHASPPCTRASNANQSAELNDDGTKEAPLDIALGKKVAEFIDVLRPRWFTLENVYQYRNFKAFGIICDALNRGGYFWDYDNVNAADYSVPQTRRRLILRAVRGALLPPLPAPEPWVGWLAAIEDLIPTLPDSKFAKWQLERLPAELNSFLVGGSNTSDVQAEPGVGVSLANEPSRMVPASQRTDWRAFILSNAKTEYGDGIRDGQEPAGTVTGESNGRVRAWLVESKNSNQQYGDGLRADYEPATTVVTDHKDSHQPRARLSQGRVVKLTPRALARLQSVPDDYILPDKAALACKVIGNGVACLMIEKIYRQLVAGG